MKRHQFTGWKSFDPNKPQQQRWQRWPVAMGVVSMPRQALYHLQSHALPPLHLLGEAPMPLLRLRLQRPWLDAIALDVFKENAK
jgi:hypothetical protein